jgi:hypothetical protein
MVYGPSFSGWRDCFESVHIAPCLATLFVIVVVILFTFRATGQTVLTERVSVSTEGTQGNNASFNPSISSDGRYIDFESVAGNLVAGDGNRRSDIFVHDRQSGEMKRVSVSTDGSQGNGDSSNPSLSSGVLDNGGLHPDAVTLLQDAKTFVAKRRIQDAINREKAARDLIVDLS